MLEWNAGWTGRFELGTKITKRLRRIPTIDLWPEFF